MKNYKTSLTLAVLLTVASGTINFAQAEAFVDTKGHWADTAIAAMTEAKYVSGFTDGTFKPNEAVTREQAANIFQKLVLSPTQAKATTDKEAAKTFKDIAADRWSASAIATVATDKIMSGYPDGNFKPEAKMTREEFAVTAANYANFIGLTNPNPKKEVAYTDGKDVSDWSKAAIIQLSQQGFLTGDTNGNINPKAIITRAEATALLYKMTHPATNATLPANATADSASTTSTAGEKAIEDKAFKILNKFYKTPNEFQNHGIMYWEGNTLHVALKDAKDLAAFKTALGKSDDADVKNIIVGESTKYTQADYDALQTDFESLYSSKEPAGKILSIAPDTASNQLVVVLSTATDATLKAIKEAYGSKVLVKVK